MALSTREMLNAELSRFCQCCGAKTKGVWEHED